MRIECEWQLAPECAGSELAGDQRTHSRHLPGEGIGLRLAVQPTYRGHRAVLFDISVEGIGLLMDQPLEVGAAIAVELRDRPSDGVSRLARVAHVRAPDQGLELVIAGLASVFINRHGDSARG